MADVTDGAQPASPLSMLEVLRYRLIIATLPQLNVLTKPVERKC